MDMIFQFLPFLQNIAPAWRVVAFLIGIAPTLAAIFTALVSFWHALIAVATGVAALPGCAKAQKLADFLKVEGDRIDANESKILAVMNRISAIPLPQKQASPAQAPAAPGAA